MRTSDTSKKPTVILGIDPGYADCGYGFIRRSGTTVSYVACGSIQSNAGKPLAERLKTIYDTLGTLISAHRPDIIAIETLYFFKNKKTAIDVAQARGVLLLRAAIDGARIVEYTPPQVKLSITSHGQATKQQVTRMVKLLLRQPHLKEKDDAIDALAIAICAAFRSRFP